MPMKSKFLLRAVLLSAALMIFPALQGWSQGVSIRDGVKSTSAKSPEAEKAIVEKQQAKKNLQSVKTYKGKQTVNVSQAAARTAQSQDYITNPIQVQPKALTATLVCLTQYVPGTTMDLTFQLDINSPDWEYGETLEIVFPSGFTINSADNLTSNLNGYTIYNAIVGQSVLWSDPSNYYYESYSGGGPAATYFFDINVSIGAGVSGLQTATFTVDGDGWGGAPHTVSGNIPITQMVSPPYVDGTPFSLLSPQPSAHLSSAEAVSVRFTNLGNTSIPSGAPVGYIVDNNPAVLSQTTSNIGAGGFINFTFSQTADLSTVGNHVVKVFIKAAGDTIAANDTLTFNIYNCGVIYSMIYDNGPLITHNGAGTGGANVSAMPGYMGTIGFGHQVSANNRVADDFTITDPYGWDVYGFSFYSYQTNSTTTSTITAVNIRIWDGEPGNGGNIIWGDTSTNRLTCSYWSNIYRTTETTITNTARPIMESDCQIPMLHLAPGTYWVDWQVDGSLSSGPWAPPITITGDTNTGNGLQKISTAAWATAIDGNTSAPQGFPFKVWGDILTPANDSCVNAIPVFCGDTVSGTTIGSTFDTVPTCYTTVNTPGVWYEFAGTGQYVTASLCSFADYDTKMIVYEGDCDSLICIDGIDDYCGLISELSWMTNPGITYKIFVFGFGGQTGDFDLAISCKDTCMTPYHILDTIIGNDVVLSWSQDGIVLSWDIEVVPLGQSPTGVPTYTNVSSPFTISGLPTNEFYTFYITTHCDSINSSDAIPSNVVYLGCIDPIVRGGDVLDNAYISVFSHSNPSYNSEMADDFSVAANDCIIVERVSVMFWVGSVPDSLKLSIYKDTLGLPGSIADGGNASWLLHNLSYTYVTNMYGLNLYEIVATLPAPVTLCGGPAGERFWLGAACNSDDGNTYWDIDYTTVVDSAAAWRNPGNGFSTGCSSWQYNYICASDSKHDQSFSLYLADTEEPVISGCPSDIQQSTDAGSCDAIVTWTEPTATDNCSYTMNSNYVSGDLFGIGLTKVTYIAVDGAGNADTCTFNVIIEDNEAPVINCSDITLGSPDGNPVTHTWAVPGVTDNCGVDTLYQIAGPANGSAFPVGTTTITYAAVDIYGNADTCEFDIIVNDVSGINEASAGSISIYPVPSDGMLYVQLPGSNESWTLSIFSADGKLVMNQNIVSANDNISLNLTSFAKGLYFLKAENTSSGVSEHIKFLLK
jgi:uncharacterized protein (UPF0333 family)